MRRVYVDWARGLAVLVMIEAHTLDAWTRLADRSTPAYRNLVVVGGFAAPAFLWLAGLALVLSAEARFARTGDRRRATHDAVRRGLEIFILAFLFRLQAFVITPGSPLLTLFRVDILNVMGPALVAAALVWGLTASRLKLTVSFAALAATVALMTPPIRSAPWVNALPIWLQWQVRPAGEHTTFTAFPWTGFVFAGAAVGVWLASVKGTPAERRLQIGIAATGVLLLWIGFQASALPTIYRSSSFWTSSPTYFAIRTGILMALLATMYLVSLLAQRYALTLAWLERLGRGSLFVYWIHVELVYGYATWPLRQRLRLWETAVAYVLFCAFMYGALAVRDALVTRFRGARPTTSRLGTMS